MPTRPPGMGTWSGGGVVKLGEVCRGCPYENNPGPVLGDGDKDAAKVIVVGEAPGQDEIDVGKGFVGKAGRELWKLAGAGGVFRNQCYVTNVVKCLPSGAGAGDYSLDPGAVDRCSTYLKEELLACRTKWVIPLGERATMVLAGVKGITKVRGASYQRLLKS